MGDHAGDRVVADHGYDAKELLGECGALLAAHGALGRCVAMHPRGTEAPSGDLRLRFKHREWLESAPGLGLVASFLSHPAVVAAEARRSDLFVTFETGTLHGLEERIAAGEEAGMGTADLLEGRRYDVSLVGPNANKALHLGHLRNIALGQALACSLETAGATVRRRSLVADIGRRMCEAMAGYLEGHRGETPDSSGLPGDRFVEVCSRTFRENHGAAPVESTPGPNPQEERPEEDTASTLMEGWLRGGELEGQLSGQMRQWVLGGHERTLSRLGLVIDVYDFESDEVPRARSLIEHGLRLGLFEREATGGVVYRSDRPEYATMVLLNDRGAPTECARVLAVCHRMIAELDPEVSFLEVLGDEWRPAQTVVADLLLQLLPDPAQKDYEWLYYGLVTSEGRKIGSSNGDVVWIDDFVDDLITSPAAASLEQIGEGCLTRSEIADVLARASFLCAPMAQPLPFAAEQLLEAQAGPAWTIAEAWSRACAVDPGERSPSPPRAGILQSLEFRPMLLRSIGRRDPTVLAGYLLRLSEGFLSAPDPGPAARPALERVLHSLGFTVSQQGTGGAEDVSQSSGQPIPVGT
ncbi:MAG TPA: arginine--tRNA ligase [Solirubrobacterales bacterium]|jgi:arginyl-tRNA synthetase|nr:arginine--tRNA ligase [Solirubrobacterales bacterium]